LGRLDALFEKDLTKLKNAAMKGWRGAGESLPDRCSQSLHRALPRLLRRFVVHAEFLGHQLERFVADRGRERPGTRLSEIVQNAASSATSPVTAT
jgi:hypothetical protein